MLETTVFFDVISHKSIKRTNVYRKQQPPKSYEQPGLSTS